MSTLDLGTLVSYLKLDDKQFEQGVDLLPDKLGGAAAGMAAAGAAVGALLGASLVDGVMAAIEKEDATARMTASLGLSAEDSERYGAIAGSLYAQAYGGSMTEVTDAIAVVTSSIGGMSDASSADIEAATATALNFASVFEVDVARAAQIAGQMMTNGLAADSTEAFDLLTAAMQTVPVSMRENVLDAVDEYAPFMSAIGIDGPQAFALLAAGAEQGQYGIDKVGDAIKELTIRAGNITDTAAMEALEGLGLNANDTANAMLAGGEAAATATDQIVAGLLSMTDPGEQAAAAIALFGTPLEDLGVQQIPEFLSALGGTSDMFSDVSGSAAEMGDTLNGTTSVAWTELQRTWEGIFSDVGSNLLPLLTEFSAWAADNPQLLQAVAIGLGVIAGALLIAAAAQWAMNSALLASPITWIILAVLALIAVFVWLAMNTDEVNAFMREVWEGFASWITGVWEGFVGWITGVWEGFVGWLTDGLTALGTWWNELWSSIGSWVQSVWDGFIAWIMGVFLGYGQWLIGVGASISSWWSGLWSSIGAFVQSVWQGFISTVSAIFRGFLSTIQGIGSSISSWWSSLWSTVRSGVESAWNGIVGWLGGIGGMILDALSGAGQWLVDIGKDVLDGLMQGLQDGWNAVVSWIEGLGGGIIDTFADILGIHSPSRVFREFGVNIGDGLLLGLDDVQDSIDSRVQAMVAVPDSRPLTYDDFLRASSEVGAEFVREGDVYHVESTDPMAVVDEIDRRKRRANALAGVGDIPGTVVR